MVKITVSEPKAESIVQTLSHFAVVKDTEKITRKARNNLLYASIQQYHFIAGNVNPPSFELWARLRRHTWKAEDKRRKTHEGSDKRGFWLH